MNRKVVKNMFDKKIDKEMNYDKILRKIKVKNRLKLSTIVKISVIQVCTIIIMILFLNNKNNVESNIPKINNTNILNINDIGSIVESYNDIIFPGTLEEVTEEYLLKKYSWLNLPVFPNVSIMENKFNHENYEYTDYYLNYYDENSSQSIEIYISEYREVKLRCIRIIENDLKDSIINGVNVKFIKYNTTHGNYYYALFKYKGLNFDIEASNILENEFVTLIESIIK